jgi:hypothetical protein
MKGNLTNKKISGRTGRSGYHQIEDRPTAHPAVQSFVTKLCSRRKIRLWPWVLIQNPIAWQLFRQVSAAATTGIFGTYYRSRRFSIDVSNPSPFDLGPPPLEKQGEGRYTEGKTVVLYLSRTPETAARETVVDESRSRIFIQKFELSLPNSAALCLAGDFETRFPELHYLLLDSEYLPDESTFVPNPYRATQLVAYLCRLRGISAVEYSSVRGSYKDDPSAVNLVLFGQAVEVAKSMMSGTPEEYKTVGRSSGAV